MPTCMKGCWTFFARQDDCRRSAWTWGDASATLALSELPRDLRAASNAETHDARCDRRSTLLATKGLKPGPSSSAKHELQSLLDAETHDARCDAMISAIVRREKSRLLARCLGQAGLRKVDGARTPSATHSLLFFLTQRWRLIKIDLEPIKQSSCEPLGERPPPRLELSASRPAGCGDGLETGRREGSIRNFPHETSQPRRPKSIHHEALLRAGFVDDARRGARRHLLLVRLRAPRGAVK